MLKIIKEGNLPEGYECIATYYPNEDKLFLYDAKHFVRIECSECWESFWMRKNKAQNLKKCPLCGK